MARSLKLRVSPEATVGGKIRAWIEAVDLDPVLISIEAPDTLVISGQRRVQLLGGTFVETLEWQVEHAQNETNSIVQIRADAGELTQIGLCRVRGA